MLNCVLIICCQTAPLEPRGVPYSREQSFMISQLSFWISTHSMCVCVCVTNMCVRLTHLFSQGAGQITALQRTHVYTGEEVSKMAIKKHPE